MFSPQARRLVEHLAKVAHNAYSEGVRTCKETKLADAMQVYFKVPVQIREEGGRFFASCFLVDVHCEGPTKFEALEDLTKVVQSFVTSCAKDRALDAVLHRHDLRLPDARDELATGRYIDVSIQLKIPALGSG